MNNFEIQVEYHTWMLLVRCERMFFGETVYYFYAYKGIMTKLDSFRMVVDVSHAELVLYYHWTFQSCGFDSKLEKNIEAISLRQTLSLLGALIWRKDAQFSSSKRSEYLKWMEIVIESSEVGKISSKYSLISEIIKHSTTLKHTSKHGQSYSICVYEYARIWV